MVLHQATLYIVYILIFILVCQKQTVSDYPFGILKFFSMPYHIVQIYKNYSILVEHLSLPPIVGGVRLGRSFVFCRSLFGLLSFVSWPFCCLSFDLRLLITSLVPSNFPCRVVLRCLMFCQRQLILYSDKLLMQQTHQRNYKTDICDNKIMNGQQQSLKYHILCQL